MSEAAVAVTIELDEPAAKLAPAGVEGLLATAVRATLAQQPLATAISLSLLLTGDAQLQDLNHTYRGYDEPTDVLSFPDGEPLPGEAAVYLGDIAISVETAQRQAVAAGHSLAAELQLLAVHGVLHLLGHDHGDPAEKAAMWAAQTAVLAGMGAEITGPPGEA